VAQVQPVDSTRRVATPQMPVVTAGHHGGRMGNAALVSGAPEDLELSIAAMERHRIVWMREVQLGCVVSVFTINNVRED